MSSHHTVIHLPVTFVTPPGTTPEDYARFMAAEAALMLEKFSNADDITVGEESIDPITPAYTDPAAASSPQAPARAGPVTLTVHDSAGTYRIGPLTPAEADVTTARLAGPACSVKRDQDEGQR